MVCGRGSDLSPHVKGWTDAHLSSTDDRGYRGFLVNCLEKAQLWENVSSAENCWPRLRLPESFRPKAFPGSSHKTDSTMTHMALEEKQVIASTWLCTLLLIAVLADCVIVASYCTTKTRHQISLCFERQITWNTKVLANVLNEGMKVVLLLWHKLLLLKYSNTFFHSC